jgi:hypothetical protein
MMSVGEQPLLTPALFEPLTALVAKYGIRNLVETGTGPRSSGLEAAKRLGLRGWSCDVYGPCVYRARDLYPDAILYHGESLGFFAQVLPRMAEPTFFWLDGHCPTDQECLPGLVFPPYEEMLLIKSLKKNYERDVLWLDDIAMVDVPDNPARSSWDVDLAGTRWQGAKDHSWAEYLAVFADTHDAEIVDGILRLTPK